MIATVVMPARARVKHLSAPAGTAGGRVRRPGTTCSLFAAGSQQPLASAPLVQRLALDVLPHNPD